MRINEVVEIAHATLINQPQISHFNHITAYLGNVVRESLFIAKNQEESKKAIALGAYGIMFEDGDLQVIDEECAWIKVDSLQDAITRLIRYKLLSSGIGMIFCKKIEFEIAKEIATDPRVDFCEGGYMDLLESIQKQGIKKVITSNAMLLEIPLDFVKSAIPEVEPFKIISCTLFDSKIYFDSERFTLSLPSLFLGYLASMMHLFQNEGIAFSLHHFESIPHLKPIFISPNHSLCAYGQSGRVLLAEEDPKHFEHYAHYILENAKWAKVVFFIPSSLDFDFQPCVTYQQKEDLFSVLAQHRFNFALILGVNSQFLIENLKASPKEASLFDEEDFIHS